jgi:hypothetical protein
MKRVRWASWILAAASLGAVCVSAAGAPSRADAIGALAVAQQFAGSAVPRTDLSGAWRLASPQLRAQVTRAAWFAGELPVPSFPLSKTRPTYRLVSEIAGQARVELTLVPRAGSPAPWGIFEIELVDHGGSWLVDGLSGSTRGCRRGGYRDPDPGPVEQWC